MQLFVLPLKRRCHPNVILKKDATVTAASTPISLTASKDASSLSSSMALKGTWLHGFDTTKGS